MGGAASISENRGTYSECHESQTHNNPIIDALMSGSLSSLESVIERNKNRLDDPDFSGYLPLYYAASRANNASDAFDLLIRHGAKPDEITTNYEGVDCSMMHFAVEKGDLDLVRFLVEKGVSTNIISSEKETPEALAARLGNDEVSKYLKKVREDIDSNNAINPLHEADENTPLLRNVTGNDNTDAVTLEFAINPLHHLNLSGNKKNKCKED